MEAIVKTDEDKTPVEERDIDYFVDRYRENYAFTAYNRHHRDIFDDDDSDVDEYGNTTTPRHPRHVSRSEITDFFAAQSEWILADQLAKRGEKRIVDIKSWHQFCLQVRGARRNARENDESWGLPHGNVDERDFENDIDLTRYPMFGKNLGKLLEAALRKQPVCPTPLPFQCAYLIITWRR
jgi:hypothetical protein